MVGRPPQHVDRRWNETSNPRLESGAWSAEEDNFLLREVGAAKAAGKTLCWSVAGRVIARSGSGVAHRWNRVLNPALRRDEWTSEETEILQEEVKKAFETGKSVSHAALSKQLNRPYRHVQYRVHKATLQYAQQRASGGGLAARNVSESETIEGKGRATG
ncbi:hypothetical protein HK104_011501 [Borealophlyctis nickersoniae]|nr:hypothetical protein HK104_011501 [Borealophlyctis nickersoniae]